MRITIDRDSGTIRTEVDEESRSIDLYSREGFELLSNEWLRVAWNQKHTYTFSWLGRPMIQLPQDMIRLQEVIYSVRPDVIIETGIAHGGSLVYYASLCKAMDHGRIVGVDIEIRPHNRTAIEKHELFPLITLIEGDSTDPDVVEEVSEHVKEGDRVLVILDSNHSKDHVARELEAYHTMVTAGSYIVATDGAMGEVYDVPRGRPEWVRDNPAAAAEEFAQKHPDFVLERPAWPFNESDLTQNVTHWPNAWLKRVQGP